MRFTETILVVDDDRTVRRAAVESLRRVGYDVLEAASGSEAMAVLGAHESPVHLLLTDVSMQGMDGGELAEAAQAARPELKVLFMSGYTGGAALHDSVREEGGIFFIAKPFVVDVLLRKVKAALEST